MQNSRQMHSVHRLRWLPRCRKGPKGKKFMVKNLKNTFVELSELPMLKQGEKLNEIFEEWKGDSPQVDDVTVIGIRYH